MSHQKRKKLTRGLFAALMAPLMAIGVYAQSSKEKSYEEALKSYSLKNADAVNKVGDFQCPNVYDRPYSYLAHEVKGIKTKCGISGILSFEEAVVKGNFTYDCEYAAIYQRWYCKDDKNRRVCCEVAEQRAILTDIEQL